MKIDDFIYDKGFYISPEIIKKDEEYMEEFLAFLNKLKEKKLLNNESCKELIKVK